MTDNNKEKQHLRAQEDILNDIEEINSIKGSISKRSLDLFSNLTNNKELFVDDDIVKSITDLHRRLSGPNNLLDESKRKYADLDAEETRILGLLPVGATAPQTNARNSQYGAEISSIRAEKKALKNVTGPLGATGTGSPNFLARRAEYVALSNHVNYFNTANKIHNVDIDLLVGPPRATTVPADINQNLDTLFKRAPRNPNAKYKLCDEKGVPLPESTPGNYTVQINGQTVTLSGIVLTGRSLDFTNLTITPPNADISDILKLSINGIYESVTTGVNIVCNKKFELQLRRGAPAKTSGDREREIINYNASGVGGHVIEESMTAKYNNELADIERKSFFNAVAHNDGPKLDKLTAEQKEDLYQRVRNIYRLPGGIPNAAVLGAAGVAGLNNLNHFGPGTLSFTERLASDEHEGSKDPKNTSNVRAYRDYVHNKLEENIRKYFEWRLDQVFTENPDVNRYLKTEVTNYLTEIEHQKLDTNVHQDIEHDITDEDEMNNERRWGIIGRRDVNYLRFFAGKDSQTSIKDQTVNINTNTHPEDLNNPQPVKYGMDMEVSGKQQILVNIKIDKQKDLSLKAGDPIALVRKVLRCPDIVHGKVRAHIVYNIMKGFIEMAQKKDISLRYRDPRNGHNMVIRMDGKNIVLEDQDDATNYGGTNRRVTSVLFDHQYFENTNTFDSSIPNDNRSLRIGIDRLMGHFNYAMEEVHLQYRQASEKRRLGLRRGETRMTLPTSFWLSPIKKILNLGTTSKFDFATNAQANSKSVSIEFKNNKFTLNGAGLKKPISSRTLGKLLRHREGGIRSFDGMEREICGKIYEELIKKMRENSKIEKTNFGVKDNITGRTYILDADGQLGYVSAEEADANPDMIRRGIVSGREYGVVDNPPDSRHLCDESETREVYKNPFLMGRLIKTMNNRMGLISSIRSLVN